MEKTITLARKTLKKGKVKKTGERKSEKNSETNVSNNKNSEQDVSHEVEPINTSNSQENIENHDIEREEDVTLQNQEISSRETFHSKFHRETF